MNITKRHIWSVILAIILLAPPSTVFAKQPGILKVSGPGIRGELTISPNQWTKLEDSWFFAQDNLIEQAPENLGEGYTLIPYLGIDGKMIPYVEIVYYPTANGRPGYYHYTARMNGNTLELEPADEWGISTRKADRAFRALMAVNNIALQPSSLSATSPMPVSASSIAVTLIATLLTTLGAALILRGRPRNEKSA